MIINASLILDHKAANKTLKLWNFISQVYDRVWMTDNHSKILLVKAASGQQVAVVTSQNLTRGNRFESTLVTTDPAIFSRLYESFSHIAKFNSVPLDEILSRRIEENRGMGSDLSPDN